MIFLIGESGVYDMTCYVVSVDTFGFEDGFFFEILVSY